MSDIVVNKYSTSDIDGLSAALASKADAAIGFTALADNTTSISKSSFAGKAGVQITYDDGNNKSITLNNDLKDGRIYTIYAKNAHATISIGIILPTPRLTSMLIPRYIFPSEYVAFYIVWNSLLETWEFSDSNNLILTVA
ncbi:MAG: hypothetical protein WC967_15800 [Balneolaceae bacterium]